MKALAASLLALTIVAAAQAQEKPIDYSFESIKRNVMLLKAGDETRVEQGQHAQSGDTVKTGWFSYALIASEASRARFEIYSATEVRLADGTAGILLTVDRGRIRAAFDKIVGSEPRVVKTPGALLAVRGTEFNVTVDNDGKTTVDVFEGVVEVQSPLAIEPMMVRAGQESIFSPRQAPRLQPIPEHRQREEMERRERTRGDRNDPGRKPEGTEHPRDGRDPKGRPWDDSDDRPKPPTTHRTPGGGSPVPGTNPPRPPGNPPA